MHLKCIPRETVAAENHPALEGWIEVGSRITDVKNIFMSFSCRSFHWDFMSSRQDHFRCLMRPHDIRLHLSWKQAVSLPFLLFDRSTFFLCFTPVFYFAGSSAYK